MQHTTCIPGLGTLVVTDHPDRMGVDIELVPTQEIQARFAFPEAYGFGIKKRSGERIDQAHGRVYRRPRRFKEHRLTTTVLELLERAFSGSGRGLVFDWQRADHVRFSPIVEGMPYGDAPDVAALILRCFEDR